MIDGSSNGLVGLAFSKLNTITPKPQRTFFDNVLPDLSAPVFTAQLKGGSPGSYEFGRIDTSAFTGQLNVVPVDPSKGFWQFDSTTAKVGNTKISIPQGSAIADTGTSLMLVGDEILQGYYNQVNSAQLNEQLGGVTFSCNEQLPDLSVAVGDSYMATIPGKNMKFANVDAQGKSEFQCSCQSFHLLIVSQLVSALCNLTGVYPSLYTEMSGSKRSLLFSRLQVHLWE